MPPAELLGERTPHVLSCIYSVFTEGYWSTAGPSAVRDELCDEGVRLADELCTLMPSEREAHALAALMLLHDSRPGQPGWTMPARWCRSKNKTGADGTAAG